MTWNLTAAQIVATFAGPFFLGYTTRRTLRVVLQMVGVWFF